jgi:hypothetical protein
MTAEPISISTVLVSAGSFLFGLWGSSFLQDRETRRRHLGVVRALAAESQRIRSELGAGGPDYVPIGLGGATAVIPSVGPWVFSVLTDIATISPDVVTAYLKLDRDLQNVKAFNMAQDRAAAALQSASEARENAAKAATKAPDAETLGPAMVAEMEAKRKEERVEQVAQMADFSAENAFRNATTSLDTLDGVLSRLDARLSRGAFTHLPWSRL